jgi:hypothetical protein
MYSIVPTHFRLSSMRVVVLDAETRSRLDQIDAARIAFEASSRACIEYLRSSGKWSVELEEMARADLQSYVMAFEACSRLAGVKIGERG